MTDYHSGQFVACVDVLTGGYGNEQKPVKGKVYTVRNVVSLGCGTYLRLVEIINPPNNYTVDGSTGWSHIECGFDVNAFLPLDPKRLDVFRDTHVPVPA